jgi:glycosyltransferase involved in cell wall biosynthesis
VLVARAVRALDPVDREIRAAGPHEVDWYFVEPAEAGRYGRLARVRRSRGHRIVAVLSPRWVPLTSTHQRLLELAEHVIVPSEFAAEIARLSSMAPVTVLPWPVDVAALPWPVDAVAPPVPVGRATDGADATDAADPAEERQGSRAVATKSSDPGERPCVFTTVVPSGVAVARSNPSAAIAAFRRAFPPPARGPSSAELVVVLEDQARRPEATAALEADLASLNARLVVDPSKRELDALLSGTDVYVSLHRAEAFALRLADAMARAKVVLATGWSGNVDYMDRSTSISVGYTVRPLNWGDLFLDPGADTEIEWDSFWVDPDLDDAARWMRRLASDPGLRARLGVAASRWVRDRLAPAVVGASARACLERMVTEGSANGPPPGRHLTPAAAAGLRHG